MGSDGSRNTTGMRVDAEFDRFVWFAGVRSILVGIAFRIAESRATRQPHVILQLERALRARFGNQLGKATTGGRAANPPARPPAMRLPCRRRTPDPPPLPEAKPALPAAQAVRLAEILRACHRDFGLQAVGKSVIGSLWKLINTPVYGKSPQSFEPPESAESFEPRKRSKSSNAFGSSESTGSSDSTDSSGSPERSKPSKSPEESNSHDAPDANQTPDESDSYDAPVETDSSD